MSAAERDRIAVAAGQHNFAGMAAAAGGGIAAVGSGVDCENSPMADAQKNRNRSYSPHHHHHHPRAVAEGAAIDLTPVD